jgi:hypothetical protein
MKEEMDRIEQFQLPFIFSLLLNNSKKPKIFYSKKNLLRSYLLWQIFGIACGIHNNKIEQQFRTKLTKYMNKKIKLHQKYQYF